MKLELYALEVGSLMYAMGTTWLGIAHIVGVVNRFIYNLGGLHWDEIKYVLRDLGGTKVHGIVFGPNDTSRVVKLYRLKLCRLCGKSKINNRILL